MTNTQIQYSLTFNILQPIKTTQYIPIFSYPKMTTSPNQFFDTYREIQSKITTSISQLNALNSSYINQQQKNFMNTCLQIMDKMSNQLSEAQELCLYVDREIEADHRCVALRNQLMFLENQSIFMFEEVKKNQELLHQAKIINRSLKCRKKCLTDNITKNYRTVSTSPQTPNNTFKLFTPRKNNKSVDLLNIKQPQRYQQCTLIKTPSIYTHPSTKTKPQTSFNNYIQTTPPPYHFQPTPTKTKQLPTRATLRTTQKQINAIKYLVNDRKKSNRKFSLMQLLT